MKFSQFLTAAYLLALCGGTAAAAGSPVTGATVGAEPGAMLRSAMHILRQEQRGALRGNLRADWARMSAAISEEMRARQLAGGPVNATVKSRP